MNDSNVPEYLAAKHARDREQRLEAIERWVEYIQSEPAETWGPQQNAVVDGQLDAAQHVETSAAHRLRVTEVASEILEATGESDDDSE